MDVLRFYDIYFNANRLCVCECRTLFEITILFDLRRTSSGGWGIMTFLETFDSRFFLYFMQGVAFGLGQHGAKLFYELIWQKYVTGGRYVVVNDSRKQRLTTQQTQRTRSHKPRKSIGNK